MCSYIAYLDLLGTKGFCEEEELYYNNIKNFSHTVETLAPILGTEGRIGIFSDCVYVECVQLDKILYFLKKLRLSLIGDNLFFNAALSKGELGVESMGIANNEKNKDENESNIFGVRFTNREISSIYCKQTNFRGIGIWVDPVIKKDIEKKRYKLIHSFYYAKEEKNNESRYIPKEYWDFPLLDFESTNDLYKDKKKKDILSIIIKALYIAHSKSSKYSAYYISMLANIIRYCDTESLVWNRTDNNFENESVEFKVLYNFLKKCDQELQDLVGLDSLCFAFLDTIYNASKLNDYDRARITQRFLADFKCLSNKYKHYLDFVPNEPFTGDNRKEFIGFCNKDLARQFVDSIVYPD